MKLKTKQFIKTLDDKDTQLTVGQAIANILVQAEVGGKMKLYVLGQDLYKKAEVDLDEADLTLIKQAVEVTRVYAALVTGQILLLLENLKTK